MVLLDPDVDRVAFGSLASPEAHRLDVVALGYDLFDASTAEAERTRILERLTALRAERDRPPPELIGDLEQKTLETANLVRSG